MDYLLKSTQVGADALVSPAEQGSTVFRRAALAHPDGASGSTWSCWCLAGLRPPTAPPDAALPNYFLSALAGTLTEAESFVISSNRFCASAISEGCVATRR